MKKIFLIISMFVLGMISINAYDLKETFYYDTQVPNMYITKIKGDKKTNGAPFLLHKSNKDLVYCIDPFLLMSDTPYEGYIGYNELFGISEDKINNMNIIAQYGYGYKNHTDLKWYGLTQYLIWEQLDLDEIYFTDKFQGNKIAMYENELNELRNLAKNYNIVPSFDEVINMESGTTITLNDQNQVLENYDIISEGLEIVKNGNEISISASKIGEYKIKFIKRNNKNNYMLFYNLNGQNLLLPGKIEDVEKEIVVNVKQGKISVQKHDEETDSPRDSLSFKDAVYGIYNLNGNLILKISLNDLGYSEANISFGSYYLQEIAPPSGYNKNDKKYYFDIDFNNNEVSLDVYDKVISKNVTIYKLYGNKKSKIYSYEKDATFEIYDEKGNLYGTYKTDLNGKISLNLIYGRYRIHQVSSMEGYDSVEDQEIIVSDNEDLELKLYDYEQIIEVPDTYKDSIDYKGTLFIILSLLIFNVGIYAYRKNIYNK